MCQFYVNLSVVLYVVTFQFLERRRDQERIYARATWATARSDHFQGGGKFVEPNSLFCHFMIRVFTLIIQPFRHFTDVTTHSPTLPSLYLRHSSFSKPSVDSSTSQQSSFSNLYVTSPTSQLILEPFRRFTYVTAYSPTFRCFTYVTAELIMQTFPSLHLRHNSFSVALPTPQLILQPFSCFTYVTNHSPTLLSLLLRYKLFT